MKSDVWQISKPTDGKKYAVDEALDIIGIGPFQRFVFFACALCVMHTVGETLCFSYILPPAKCDLELDTMRIGIITSVTSIGIISTSHVSGFLTDTVGRKKTVFLSISLSATCSAIAALIPNFWAMVVFRLLSGMSMAAASSGAFVYMSEFFPARSRGSTIMYCCSASALATTVMPIIGMFIQWNEWEIPLSDSYTIYGWRLQLLVHLIPGLLSLVFLRQLPESPKFLFTVNRAEESLEVLHAMYARNSGLPAHQCPIQELSASDLQVTSDSKKTLKGFLTAIVHETGLLLKPPHLKLISACCFLQFGAFVVCGGVAVWFSELSNRILGGQVEEMQFCDIFAGQPINVNGNESSILLVLEPRSLCETVVHEKMLLNNFALGLAHVISYFLLGRCLNKISLKSTTVWMLVVGCICGFAIQYVQSALLVLVCFCLFIVSAGMVFSLVNAIAVDLFPTQLRGMAISMSVLIGRMGTVVGANTIGYLFDLNCGYTLHGIGVLVAVCTIIAAFLPKKNYNI